MTLTTEDLKAIAELFDTMLVKRLNIFGKDFNDKLNLFNGVINKKLDALDYKVDYLYEDLSGKLQVFQDSVQRIENVQPAEVSRVDRHDLAIARLNKHCGLQ